MSLRSRRTAFYLGLVVLTTVLFTVLYNLGMGILENRPQPLYRSLQVVIQSFTTTGYGEDAAWQTPHMNLLAIVMQLAGIGLILTAVDVFAVPWLRDAVSPSAPTSATDVTDHVVVCEHTPRTEAFIQELDARDREYVLLESDEATASDLHEDGYRVVHGDPEATAALEDVGIQSALAVVADAADDRNASIALAVRDVRADVRLITLVEDASLARYHRAAGADVVLSPRQLLGRSLANRVPTPVRTDVDDGVVIGEDFQLVELAVARDSDLAGQTFASARLRERFGVNVIGAWVEGTFETPVQPDDELAAGTRLLVAGEADQVAALGEATASPVREFASRDVVLAGYGDSGRAAAEALEASGVDLCILDVTDDEGVDVVGDARDPDVLAAAGVGDAGALVLTVAEDTTAIFTTLIARERNPDLHVVVRANEEGDVPKLYRAGADYVQSLATVSGRMLASTVFEDEEVLTYEQQVRVARLPAGDLAGSTLVAERVRSETGATVVAIVRDGERLVEFDPETETITAEDEVVVAGADEAIARFERQFTP